jgi:hypothetical protein
MKDWKGSLLWEGIPLLMLVFVFGFLALINWGYEGKLLVLDRSSNNWTGTYMGLILSTMADGQMLLASVILFVIRVIWPKMTQGVAMLVPLTLVAIFLIFPSLFIIILGLVTITMIEQERSAPR